MPETPDLIAAAPRALLAAFICAGLAACAGLPKIADAAPAEEIRPLAVAPTELYTRIARGALSCWFGAKGILKADYAYQAEAEPASRGGKAAVVVRVRDATAPNKRGVRAFTVKITPKGEQADLELTNQRLPEPLAARLKADVERWVGGDLACGEETAGTGWTPSDAKEEPSAPAKKPKTAAKKK